MEITVSTPTPETPARSFNWKRALKFTAGAGALWITIEILLALAVLGWFVFS